ncbi:N-acetylmuramic acid 6-phosphate etherase [Lipingzhangella halophila]|uniref:N-acetylmuramic acid 6-phosphate etherase n=1 Tax=Lipingzhangella halophila TaxID=1783352 RepID=A0A7W7RJ45_9ACTN|nr:N-acetylmuramic acid 6-phosphate etherase [Lipingzhangella halophila]MBB4932381.1 N-acetylmuramic acid 6-phosphate etherase [Lipingzhangella halophila]
MPQSRDDPGSPVGDDRDTLNRLPTEQIRPGCEDLDLRPVDDVVGLLLDSEGHVPSALHAARAQLAAAVREIAARFARGGRLVYVGAGTPGRIALLDAVECAPTFGVEPERVTAIVAGGDEARESAAEDAEDDIAQARTRLAEAELTSEDVVVGITASGRTPFVLEGLAIARAAGATTMAVTNNPGQPVSAAADHVIELRTGPEVLAGSTRLTAGTAQKVALNVLSTASMVRWGRTYGGWMVGVQATNGKLRGRAVRIIQEITGVDPATAGDALDAAAQETQTALVMVLLGVDAGTARGLLKSTDGRVRDAVSRGDTGERP